MTRRRYERQAMRQARRVRDGGADAGATMRLAVLVAMVLVALAVAAGFQGERLAEAAAGRLSALEPLIRPVFLGASALELIAVLIIALIAGGVIWRAFRR
ncbi:hypothetical protein [Alkalicaulis satelles]|uniref:hypothetical protein n=1 Tax=Alkalicaulis satelles TaxID=2609175 RepID=UPI0018EC7E4D|nr:hypothetical protein [Alkalicaulis satelles]